MLLSVLYQTIFVVLFSVFLLLKSNVYVYYIREFNQFYCFPLSAISISHELGSLAYDYSCNRCTDLTDVIVFLRTVVVATNSISALKITEQHQFYYICSFLFSPFNASFYP